MSKVTECIILAGGKGTRLATVIADKPKCLADIAGLPFLHYLLRYLEAQGITRIVYSLGHLSEQVVAWVTEHSQIESEFVVEKEPLGTGGAIVYALQHCVTDSVLVVNGDTMFSIDVQAMAEFHSAKACAMSMALKPLSNFDRYGTVKIDATKQITEFAEKQACESGLINGGVYIINRNALLAINFPQKFGFEQDYMVNAAEFNHQLYGYESDAYFIDIGIPEDYEIANTELPQLLQTWIG
ncbi:MAG: hypothetical protein RL660_2852 [Bacteroidota bacterium]